MNPGNNPLLGFVEFERRVMSSNALDELGFVLVNDLRSVLSYRQAVFWRADKGIVTVSGIVEPSAQSPFVLFLEAFFKALDVQKSEPYCLAAQDVPEKFSRDWGEWLAEHVYILPLAQGVLLISRKEAFSDAENIILKRLILPISVTERALGRRVTPKKETSRRRALRYCAVLLVLFILFLIPVRDSVLAVSEMVAREPSIIRAPMEGVVDEVFVEPNQIVKKDDPLFAMDLTTLAGKLSVAEKEQATAEAQYREMAQAQLFDPKAKVQVALMKAKISEREANVAYLEGMFSRGRVLAPRDGVAVFDDVTEWIGRPVSVGEKVMQLAEPFDTEIEAWIALADIGTVKRDAPLSLFLNTDPLHPLPAKVVSVAYEASTRPDGSMAYRVRAKPEEPSDQARIGLKGVARISGDRIAFGWWLLRKPVAFFRQRTGL